MTVTMKDIAKAAGVSKTTVSKVLNGSDEHISADTKRRIRVLVKKMNYVPNSMARGLKIKQTRMLGFILPDITNPFFPEIARGIEDTAKEHGFGVVMCNTDNAVQSENECFKFLTSKMVDGIIFIHSMANGNIDDEYDFSIPTVIVDRKIDLQNKNVGQVFIDTKSGIHKSTQILISRGCRKIAFISALYHSDYDRIEGYREALEEAQIPFNQNLIYQDEFNVKTGYEGMNEVLSRNQIDGVVCGDDLIAIGAMNSLKQHRIKIPDQVKIMGFDDIYFAQYTTPALSTICQPAYKMGQKAAIMLVENIIDRKPLYDQRLDFTIQMRESV